MKQHVYKQVVYALFEGRATSLQKVMIEEWLAEPHHQELYFQWLEEWESQNPQLIVDVEDAYSRLPKQTDFEQEKQLPLRPLVSRQSYFWWLVASVFIGLGIGMYFFRDELRYQHFATAFGEIRKIQLLDGSQVTLNANSTLKVPRFGFGENSREVFLTGEAEFWVQHLPDHQRFIVRTPDQLEVQVLGTEFMVYSRSRGSKVVLNKGKVQLRSLKNQEIKPMVITTGDVVTISTQGRLTLQHNQSVAVHTGWKEHRFTFNNTSVAEIAYQITERFGTQIIISDSTLAKRTLGGTFKAETAEEILQVMAEMLEVRMVRDTQSDETNQRFILTY
jgi:transmembrane sensor